MSTVSYVQLSKLVQLSIALLIAAVGLSYIGPKLLAHSDYDDFRIMWAAGKLWASGQNPYVEANMREYEAALGGIVEWQMMYYPPYWFPIVVPFSFLSFEKALVAWRALSLALLIAAAFLASGAVAGKNPARFRVLFLFGVGYATLMQPTILALLFGQTSLLVCFGLAAVFYGLARKSRWALTAGLVVVAMKPNVGAVVFAAVCMMPEWRGTLARAAFILILAATPALLLAPVEAMSGLLSNLGRYYDPEMLGNAPGNMIGVFHFIGGPPYKLAAGALVAAAAIVSLIVFRLEIAVELKFVWMTLAILLLAPLHSYDAVMLTVPATFIASRMRLDPQSLLASAGLFICLRPASIAQAFGLAPEAFLRDSGPITVGLFVIAGALLVQALPENGMRGFRKVPDGAEQRATAEAGRR